MFGCEETLDSDVVLFGVLEDAFEEGTHGGVDGGGVGEHGDGLVGEGGEQGGYLLLEDLLTFCLGGGGRRAGGEKQEQKHKTQGCG